MSEIPFRTAYDGKNKEIHKPCPVGTRFETVYKERYNELGEPYLEAVEKKDVYALIQSHKDEVDLKNILIRYAAGDKTVMTSIGAYTDISEMPNSLNEAFQKVQSMKNSFETSEAKTKFKDFNEYIQTAGTKEWLNKMNPKTEVKEEKTNES